MKKKSSINHVLKLEPAKIPSDLLPWTMLQASAMEKRWKHTVKLLRAEMDRRTKAGKSKGSK